jgi:hypothetical protein
MAVVRLLVVRPVTSECTVRMASDARKLDQPAACECRMAGERVAGLTVSKMSIGAWVE